MKLSKIHLYRITHIENIPHILQYGTTYRKSKNTNPSFKTIGDRKLIDTRSFRKVWVDNGDYNKKNKETITLGDYIPFYFGVRMPMLYVIQNGGNFVEQATLPENIVYIACSFHKILESEATFYFSDGHATDNFTIFYDKTKYEELPKLVNWESIKTSYWGGQENLNKKREKQAEFLVGSDLSIDTISGLGCYNKKAKTKLIKMGVNGNTIKVIPKAYY